MTTPSTSAGRLLQETLSLLLAASCAGCDEPGVLLCEACGAALAPDPQRSELPNGIPAVAALPFQGVAARSIRAVKEEGMTSLIRPLAAALADVLPQGIAAVPVPTTRVAFRRRGFRLPDLLVRRAGAARLPALAPVGRTVDQRGLDREERARNVRGSLRARVTGEAREIVIVDDVMTTGATLSEAARVLSGAGFRVRAVAALAATPKRFDRTFPRES